MAINSKLKKLAIVTTHPIQYYAPLFQLLHERQRIHIKIFYSWGSDALNKIDPGFQKNIDWDIPLLSGYPYEWLENTAAFAGSHHFKGIINPYFPERIDDFQPDAIMVFGWAYHSHLKIICHYQNKIPIYFRGDSTLLDQQTFIKSFAKKIFLTWLYNHINQAFYVGSNNKMYFKHYGLAEGQLTFAPHAIDNERFSADRRGEALALRAQLGIDAQDIVILFAGKMEEKKAPDLLLEAFISMATPQLNLLFVGNGELEVLLRHKSKDYNNIHFLDFQNQSVMPVIYQLADLFCLPSRGPGESWGLAVNEAMACGKPVVVSDKCGCAVDLVTASNGAIFRSGNLKSLTAALLKVLAKPADLVKRGKASAAIIKSWNFAHIADAIENKLLNTTGNNRHNE